MKTEIITELLQVLPATHTRTAPIARRNVINERFMREISNLHMTTFYENRDESIIYILFTPT